MIRIPEEIKERIVRRLIKKAFICFALYVLFYYAFLHRYSYDYYVERIGALFTALLFTALLILPYFLSGLHGYIIDKSYEGTVISLRRTREMKPFRGGDVWYTTFIREQCIAVRATIRLDNGEVINKLIRKYDFDDLAQSLCQVGDRVRHIKGAPYTQIYGVGKRHDVDCVWCGHYNDKRDKNCERCNSPLIQWAKIKLPKEENGEELREALREEEPNVGASRYTGPSVVDASEVHDNLNYSQKPTRYVEDAEFEIGEVTPTPEFGTYKRRVDPFDFLALFGVSIAGLAVAGYICLIITKMFESHADKWIFSAVCAGVIPTIITVYYMRSYPASHYRGTVRFPAWIMQASLFILPAELLRLFVSSLPLLGNAFGSLFSPLSHLWWYLYYMLPSERFNELERGIYIAEDYSAYFSVAVPAMLLRTSILFVAYYFFWRQYEKERKIMFSERNGRK